MQSQVKPTNGMTITEDTQFAPGVYALPDGIRIGADNITVSGENTTIIHTAHDGAAIHNDGHDGVTVRDLSIFGFYFGIRMENCRDVCVENVNVRGTHEIAGIDTFLYLWLPIEDTYGGAILLHNVESGTVRGCDLQHQMNGVLLYNCTGATVEENNASFNSGWGIYLSRTMDSLIHNNQFDFCNRLYRRPENGTIRAEADSAGIVLVKASSRNRFLKNTCIAGGDGIFIAGYEHPGKIDPCNDNLFEDNDCRLSPNNAIEATFSQGNIFRRNDCSRSNYGFWMGYSWDNILEDNHIEFNRFVGIAAEHAFNFSVRNNTVRQNGEGIRLWTRGGGPLEYYPDHRVCHHFTIEGNVIEANTIGFNGYTTDAVPDEGCHHFTLDQNVFDDNRIGVRFDRVSDSTITGNTFKNNVQIAVHLENKTNTQLGDNRFENNTQDVVGE
jgi:parallel beta-helix repeat protein